MDFCLAHLRKETTRIETFLTEWDSHRIGVRIFRETSHSNRSFNRRNQRRKFARVTTMKVFVKQKVKQRSDDEKEVEDLHRE